MTMHEINSLEEQIFAVEAKIAFLKARQLAKLPMLIRQLEMLEHRSTDDDALIEWLRSFLLPDDAGEYGSIN